MNKRFWMTALTLTGTMIGAGILGLPFVIAKSGFAIGIFWILFLAGILVYIKLCLGEVALRTKTTHHLPGYTEIYLGENAKKLMFFSMVFGIYSALIAYMIGESQSISMFFTGTLRYSIYFAIGFWVVMTLLLREGLSGLKKVETYGVIAIVFITIILFVWFLPNIEYNNLNSANKNNFFMPYGVVLFSLLGFSCIPELRREIKGSEKLLNKAIVVGAMIAVFIYILFVFTFVGRYGISVGEVATLSSGRFVSLLGVFTMLTSYFVLSFALKDIFIYDFKTPKKRAFVYVSIIPLLILLGIIYFNLASFVMILGIGGVVSGGLTGVVGLIMSMKAKHLGKRKPEYEMPLNWWMVGILSFIFVVGVVLELVS